MTRLPTGRTTVLALVLGGGGLLAGCAHTSPGAGADITYNLPKTDVSTEMTLTLTTCDTAKIEVDAEAALVAKAGAGRPVRVDGAALTSGRIERDLTIETGEDLVLTGVNAQATDKTGEIIANVAKTALSLVKGPAPASFADNKEPCVPEVRSALQRVQVLKTHIETLRGTLANGSTPADSKLVKEIAARQKERAELQTHLLQVTTSAPVAFAPEGALPEEGSSGTLTFDPADFKSWFDPAAKVAIDKAFVVNWTAKRQPKPENALEVTRAGLNASAGCRLELLVPAPTPVVFTIQGAGAAKGMADVSATKVFPVAQVNMPAPLCLDVGLFEKRGVELAFDKFGRTTKLHWTSDATAANATAAIAGVAPDVRSLLAKTPQPTDVDRQKAEIERLKTLQEYNQLKACEAVLAAGGSDCTAAEE